MTDFFRDSFREFGGPDVIVSNRYYHSYIPLFVVETEKCFDDCFSDVAECICLPSGGSDHYLCPDQQTIHSFKLNFIKYNTIFI
jgi:hypothetical protein